MYTDERGLTLSAGNEDAARTLSLAIDHFLGLKKDAGDLAKGAIEADPEFMFAHVFFGYLMMLMRNSAYLPQARESLAAAEALAEGASEHERMHLDALRAWVGGDMGEHNRILEALLRAYPLDLLALKTVHFSYFWLGDCANMRDTAERVLPRWDQQLPGYGYVLGIRAFGLEECGEYAEAERAGRHAVDLNPEDHWGAHAVAHIMEMQGRQREGVAWLDGLKQHWSDGGDFINHLWWHRTLYHLELDQVDEVMRLYDEKIFAEPTDSVIILLNAISLLWRLDLAGIPVGKRWSELGEVAAARVGDHMMPFNDMHWVMALVADGREGDFQAFMKSMGEDAMRRPGTWAPVFAEMTRPLCEALAAFRAGDYDVAVDGLLAVRGTLHHAGGSHAQRDVVMQTLISAATSSGRHELARDLLLERTEANPNSAPSWKRYAGVLNTLGDQSAAEAASTRASELLVL